MPHDGGPAFPMFADGNAVTNERSYFDQGMSLRDWFAGQVMGGLSAQDDDRVFHAETEKVSLEEWREKIINEEATHAYRVADAMLKARSLNR